MQEEVWVDNKHTKMLILILYIQEIMCIQIKTTT